ncbi:hypothetical protein ACQ4PT_064240 [Festuca glaucescens]
MAASSEASVFSVAASANPGETLLLVKCACYRRRSVIRLVSRSEDNLGRVFFKCPNHKQEGSKPGDGRCNFFFWFEAYVEKLLLEMGVPVHALELECVAWLAADEKTDEIGPLSMAAISTMHRSSEAKNGDRKKKCNAISTNAENYASNKMGEDVPAQIKFRLDVIFLAVNLYAAMK